MEPDLYEKVLSRELFMQAGQVEIRPGRKVFLLDIPHESSQITLFFVHGSCATMLQMAPLLKHFSGKYRVIAYDLYGCGLSPKPEEWAAYSRRAHSSDLLAIFNRYAGHANFIIGHSFGTSLAIELGATFTRQNIEGFILMGTTRHIAPHPIFKLPLWLLECLGPYLGRTFRARAFHPLAKPEVLALAEKVSGSNPMSMCKAFYRQFEWVKEATIRNIITPTVIIQGKDDKITPLQGAESLCSIMVSASMQVVDQASHQVMEEKPEKVSEIIEDFIGVCTARLNELGLMKGADEQGDNRYY